MACMLASVSGTLQTPAALTSIAADRVASGQRATCCSAQLQLPRTCRWQPSAQLMVARSHSAQPLAAWRCTAALGGRLRSRRPLDVRGTLPDPTIPETEKERSPLDYPQEWITPQPSRRPDIFPEFEKQPTPMPKPMPGDPELPDEEEQEDEEKKKKDPEKDPEEDPSQPKPDTPEE